MYIPKKCEKITLGKKYAGVLEIFEIFWEIFTILGILGLDPKACNQKQAGEMQF